MISVTKMSSISHVLHCDILSRYGLESPRREYLYAVGGDCDWNYGEEPNRMYGTIRIGDWKLKIGQDGK